ncbi:hypothetical protein ACHHYP_04346 [Achlya hypogyna]|uniref:Phosducin domain-containing protein n=1 Tax=Achlya hypogyna TaxID=1202772 RepID=A0A1V9Z1C9_ACHHY|nr:hypothetical protein ACHHYP_04346 [Achlya hypogyna]
MDDFFLRHDVYKDRDPDEIGGKVNSDSEASDDEPSLPASAADPTGPWSQGRFERQGKRRTFSRSKHTGPKGVITDYKAYKQAKAAERQQNDVMRSAVLNRIAKGAVVPSRTNNSCGCYSDDDDDFSDDEMMQEFRAKRMLEMQQAVNHGRPVFGAPQHVDPFAFVDLVDSADARVHVIVHMSDERNQVCIAINNCLETVANDHPHTQFLVVRGVDADASLAPADLPLFLVYQGGQQVESMVQVFRALQGVVTPERLESLLAPYL